MKNVLRKFSCFALAVVMVFSMAVACLPIQAYATEYDSNLVIWCLDKVYDGVDSMRDSAIDFAKSVAADCVFDKTGPIDSREEMIKILDHYKLGFRSKLARIVESENLLYGIWSELTNGNNYVRINYDPVTKVMRPYCDITGKWLTNSNGLYPYCTVAVWNGESDTGDLPATDIDTTPTSVNHFVALSWVSFKNVVPVPLEVLRATAQSLGATCCTQMVKNPNGEVVTFWVIYTSRGGASVYCNAFDYPFVAYYEPEKTAVGNTVINNITQVENKTENNTENNYEGPVNQGNIIDVDNSQKQEVNGDVTLITDPNYTQLLVDMSNMVFNQINENGDRITQNIDGISYDMSTNTYTVNTYDYVYNIENNFYEYNYYTYNIQYTYNYTYVTYIGATAEYQPKEWALYYELPDGRSSADLTEVDVAGLSFQFADCINYKKSVTDTALRALYHFDGNVDDSSYYGNADSFTWNKGASLTYMESNAFDGCLYLDEREHQFTLTLPANIGSGDFTLQWRYYQNSGANESNNTNYVTIGGNRVLSWSGMYLFNSSGTALANISIGTWQELALIRHKGTLYFYHNGVKIGSVSNTTIYSNIISFYLGTNRAYSMFDELRFVKGALYTNGAAYTPTQVPYDTNAVLVLPDSPTPVVDNYWQWDTSITPLKAYDFTKGELDYQILPALNTTDTRPYVTSGFAGTNLKKAGSFFSTRYNANMKNNISNRHLGAFCVTGSNAVFVDDGFLSLRAKNNTVGWEWVSLTYTQSGYSYNTDTRCFYFSAPTFSYLLPSIGSNGISENEYVTFDFVFSDGEVFSWTVFLEYTTSNFFSFLDSTSYRGLSLALYRGYEAYPADHTYFLTLAGEGVELVYMDMVEGTKGNTNHEYITAVYDADELQPNTAAIQTTIPITGYTVGGVRPTFPERGNVWFQVENNRISSVQVYNGRAWEGVNARWWTGKRWIPIYAFDLTTLADMWDVTGADGSGDVSPPITSDQSFWNWWKDAWLDFRQWLALTLAPGGTGTPGDPDDPGGSGDGSGDGSGSGSGGGLWQRLKDAFSNALATLIESIFGFITDILELVLDLVYDLLSFFFDFLTSTVIDGLGSFFAAFTSGDFLTFFQRVETTVDEDGNEVETTVFALPDGIASVFALFAGIFLALPPELRYLLIFGIAATALISVFHMARS